MTPKEFEEQALPHLQALYNMALKLTMKPADAEDLVQETFFKAFKSLKSFESGTNAKAWLFKIMINTNISKHRKKANRPQITKYDDIEEFFLYRQVHDKSVSLGGHTPAVLNRFVSEDIRKAIASLPEQFKEVVLLVDVEGFAYKEAGEILGVPIGTVMSRLHRGRKILQKLLWEYAEAMGYVDKSER